MEAVCVSCFLCKTCSGLLAVQASRPCSLKGIKLNEDTLRAIPPTCNECLSASFHKTACNVDSYRSFIRCMHPVDTKSALSTP
jgi:hypothetical protein